MILHPWPSNDVADARASVLWKSGFACGLLTDTPAVPLRFNVESFAGDLTDGAPLQLADAAQRAAAGRAEVDAAVCRVSRLEGSRLPGVR